MTIHVVAEQDEEQAQVIMTGKTYHLRRTRNPSGWAILVPDKLCLTLLCPGCGDPVPTGSSEDCSCYQEVSDEKAKD